MILVGNGTNKSALAKISFLVSCFCTGLGFSLSGRRNKMKITLAKSFGAAAVIYAGLAAENIREGNDSCSTNVPR
jgi:hypothetical protein